MLPRYVNLFTTASFCLFMVTFGSLYGFPGAGWYIISVFLVLIVVAGSGKHIHGVLHVLYTVGIEGAVISKQKVPELAIVDPGLGL